MALVYPRGMNLTIQNNSYSPSPSQNNPVIPDVSQPSKPLRHGSRLLNYIPGYYWIKSKVGRFIHGPTYNMTDTELQQYKVLRVHELQIANLRKEREADFKVAKYMASVHPDFYWEKYVFAFDKGTEERKRGVFLFALTNKEMYGNYYGMWLRHEELLDTEFEEMGINMEGQNVIKQYTEDTNSTDARLTRRDMNGDEDRRIYKALKQIVQGLDISHLLIQNSNLQNIMRTRRRWRNDDKTISTQANYGSFDFHF